MATRSKKTSTLGTEGFECLLNLACGSLEAQQTSGIKTPKFHGFANTLSTL